MTLTQSPCSGSHSVSPSSCKVVGPVLGTASSSKGPTAVVDKEQVVAAEVPAENETEKEKQEADEVAGVGVDEAAGVGVDEPEMKKPRVGARPVLPTKAEVEAHFPLHLEYRSWCTHCRAGKARLAPHMCEASGRDRLGITMSCDYAFLGSEEATED